MQTHFTEGKTETLRDEPIRGVCSALGLALNSGLLTPIQLGTEHVSRFIGNILLGPTLLEATIWTEISRHINYDKLGWNLRVLQKYR